MSDKLVKRSRDPKVAETVGLVKGVAVGAGATVAVMTIGFWPLAIGAGAYGLWKLAGKLRSKE